jgi:hypothetical protein
VVVLAAASLALSACGTPASTPAIIAVPSLNVSVPLTLGACDGAGTCYSVGTTDYATSPSSVGQVAPRGHPWVNLTVPAALDAVLLTMSCGHGGCLVLGGDESGALAWRVQNSTIATVSAPPAWATPNVIGALDCFGSQTCGAVMSNGTAPAQFSVTHDGGSSWSAPIALTHADVVIDSLSCSGPAVCVATGERTSSGHLTGVTLSSTNGGATWALTSSPTWRNLIDVECQPAACVALAQTASGSTVVSGGATGAGWTPLAHQPSVVVTQLACASATTCVAAGSINFTDPPLDELAGGHWTSLTTTYLPTGIDDLACGPTRCVAVDATAVAEFSP